VNFGVCRGVLLALFAVFAPVDVGWDDTPSPAPHAARDAASEPAMSHLTMFLVRLLLIFLIIRIKGL
jgi:hypothetical protein